MESTWMPIASAANGAASAILAVALAYLWRLCPEDRAPAFWSGALFLVAVRHFLILFAPASLPPPTILAGLGGALPPVLFYAGALRFLDIPAPAWRVWAMVLGFSALIVVSVGGDMPYIIGIWVTVVLLAGVNLLTALAFLRAARAEPEVLSSVLGALFILWALQTFLYPVYGMDAESRAYYLVPNSLVILATSIALIIAIQRRLHLRALHAQQDLEASNRRFQDFVDTATAWIWEMDAERRITYVSPRIYDSLGIPPATFLGRRFRDTPGIAETSLTTEEIAEIFRPDQPFHGRQFSISTIDGRRLRISISGKPIFDAAGRHSGFRGIAIDITETTRLQAALNTITAAIAHSVGPDYFRLLVEHLTTDLGADFALVGERLEGGRIRVLTAYGDGAHQPAIEYDLDGTPCTLTLSESAVVIESDAASRFPRDTMLTELGIQGYAGVALRDGRGDTVGVIAVMSRRRLDSSELLRTVLSAVAPRAGAEMERQIAETALRESEARFRALIDNMPIGFHLTDAQGCFVLRNATLNSWTRRDGASTIGRSLRQVAQASHFDFQVGEAELREVVASGKPLIRERLLTHSDGTERPVLICRFPIFGSAGAVAFVGTLLTDLTTLKRLEQRVRDSEALFRAVIDYMPIGFHLADAQGRIVERNQTLQRWTARDNTQIIGRTPREVESAEPGHHDSIESELRAVIDTRRPVVRERMMLVGDEGKPRPVLVQRFPVFGNADALTFVATLVTDLTDIKHMEAQVRQSEARLQRVVSALDLADRGVVLEDPRHRPIYINRTAGELMGAESSAIGMLERAGVGAELDLQGSWSGEIIHRTRRGTDAILQISTARLPDGGTVTLLDDATERLERERRQAGLERQVLEAQKMDAVGQLAGGIAHDFNNLVGAILGFARFIAEDTDPQSRVHGYAERILSASQRARDVIQQILTFSRRENAPRQIATLSDLLEESAHLLRATLPATLGIEIRNAFPEARALVNATQITQILVNLCLNAADAMSGRSGTLVLSLDRVPDVDERLRWLFATDPGSLPKLALAEQPDDMSRCYVGALTPGRPYLVLGVEDHGTGMPPDVLSHIFDPFFTTKERGQGTGLGLPVVHKLVLAHEGAIVISTRAGRGTLFEILLPLNQHAADLMEVPAVSPSGGSALASQPRARVLVVDDDLHFGDMVSTALDRAGYEVGVCGRPGEALEVMKEEPTLWDVLVTDQTMPEMSGLELISRLKTLHPGLRCILCTGYASSRVSATTAAAAGADAFFHKPVEVSDLLRTIAGFTAPETPPSLDA